MSEISTLLSDVLSGHRLSEIEATRFLNCKDRQILRIAAAADEMRERRAGDIVTYVKNQNLHVTNICKNLCGFCGFGRRAEDEGAYCNDKAAIQAKDTPRICSARRVFAWIAALSLQYAPSSSARLPKPQKPQRFLQILVTCRF